MAEAEVDEDVVGRREMSLSLERTTLCVCMA